MNTLSSSGKPLIKILLFLVIVITARLAGAQDAIQRSHIEGNFPAPQSFHTLLNRDLLRFFRETHGESVSSVDYRLLRDFPAQSGVALPKYYAWVKVFAGAEILVEGAARIAAIEKIQFDVLHFLTVQEIQGDPGLVKSTFPAPLITEILKSAGVKQ